MSNSLKISLAARCEAAGRSENEDNFQVAEDLSVNNVGFTTDKVIPIGDKGTLLLVCDGMGGMNAGEVASAIGVATIKNLFAPNMLTSEVLYDDNTITAYIRKAIVTADAKIKEAASTDSAKQGMGSTAVLAWIIRNKVYVGWCGDSRCYRFNPAYGLEQLSHDHSYVQDLVDSGKLSPDLAFDHPNKNIITRSLGDPRGAARPDVRSYDLRDGDVIMLCSDGLSDSLRDSEIASSIRRGGELVSACRDALWEDSYRAGWHDNVTIVLARVGYTFASPTVPAPEPVPPQTPDPKIDEKSDEKTPVTPTAPPNKKKLSPKIIAIVLAATILIVVVVVLLVSKPFSPKGPETMDPKVKAAIETVDSLLENKKLNTYDKETYDKLIDAYLIAPDTCQVRWKGQIKKGMKEAQWGNNGDDKKTVLSYAEKLKITLE